MNYLIAALCGSLVLNIILICTCVNQRKVINRKENQLRLWRRKTL